METATKNNLARDVLIIDDNADLAQSLRELLQYYGCRVETAADGFEGVRKAISGRFDVIFIDIAMPGMTGYEVAARNPSRLPRTGCADRGRLPTASRKISGRRLKAVSTNI